MVGDDFSSDVDERAELLQELYEHIRATGELPVETESSRWLGEAEAIAADLALEAGHGNLTTAVVERRVTKIRELLQGAGETGSEEADERVAEALEVADRILALR